MLLHYDYTATTLNITDTEVTAVITTPTMATTITAPAATIGTITETVCRHH